MIILIIIVIILIILIAILNRKPPIKKEDNQEETNENEEIIQQDDLSKYRKKTYIMTKNELFFYRVLKQATDELNLSIFPQVRLENIIEVIDKNNKDRNKIKSRSVDFTIVENEKCKIIACIELDDSTHERASIKEKDEIRNNLFEKVGIPLHRIKVQYNYNKDELKNILEQDIKNTIQK